MEISPPQDKDSSFGSVLQTDTSILQSLYSEPFRVFSLFSYMGLGISLISRVLEEEVLLGGRKQKKLTNTAWSRLHLIFGDSSSGRSFLIVNWEHTKSYPPGSVCCIETFVIVQK